MSHTRIAALLEARLGEWADANDIPVAWENTPMDPPDGLYLQAYAMPATTTAIDLAEKLHVLPGVWQINVNAPAGDGTGPARDLADQIAALFPLGMMLTEGPLTCYIHTPPTIYRGISSDTRYSLPISMNYRGQLINN
ncbi:DUF4128 domain-containing protein [Serratia fonticola]|uniref:DUF4128 domain-containing protein n=1 Tax=Serratia fonticola TaxID=47917 RepID=UPI00093FF62E|nr:DUF4128 domain-containing protein [Serratia fonticola]MDQ7207408.1 DUF4128 domain-containing protein [Serratia fonticola]OKP17181.1 hypothetical protein BSQ40_28720 [Serratia fonticola]HBE9077643.1 DUF4128 domain-containing protein [Serratia fonticola]HBE9088214.1 DUF4128 domain-containing protein [Serratia fonticola]HBE9150372.1 DUF4128 domain-containing protein [Serratia fonticola]